MQTIYAGTRPCAPARLVLTALLIWAVSPGGPFAGAMAGTDFVGDDLAQMWIAQDGTMRAINPENGIFGIVADVNLEGDPFLMKCLREPGTAVIWSNVLVDEKSVPHWTGNGEDHPDKGINFQGEWFKGKKDAAGKEIPISHPKRSPPARNGQSKSCVPRIVGDWVIDPPNAGKTRPER